MPVLQDKYARVVQFALQTLRAMDPYVFAQRRYAGAVVRIMTKNEYMRCTCLALYALSRLDSDKLKEYAGAVNAFLYKKFHNQVRFAALQTMGCLDEDVLVKYIATIIIILKDENEHINVRFSAFKAILDFNPEQHVKSSPRLLRYVNKMLLLLPYNSRYYEHYENQRVDHVNWDEYWT